MPQQDPMGPIGVHVEDGQPFVVHHDSQLEFWLEADGELWMGSLLSDACGPLDATCVELLEHTYPGVVREVRDTLRGWRQLREHELRAAGEVGQLEELYRLPSRAF